MGPYEILAPIGAGGMGEVYRAKDTKLGRDVAIKVLPRVLAEDPERLARFEREAKILASLNHPNIAQIYGLEDRALVMELVPGETLKGPLPLDEALRIAAQIASALEAAHGKGIVHRDLKPGNIMITPAGVVKVLDFGLAAVMQPVGDPDDPGNSPTLTMSPTRAGMILGTAPYMSPEQARGKPVDKRADIWAFGVVLYEMLTGQPLFHGDTVSDILAAVLREQPDWERVPVKLRPLLQRCLEKDPEKRLRDIGDMGLLLEDAPVGGGLVRLGVGHARPLPWVLASVFLLTALALGYVHFREAPPQERSLQFQAPLPGKLTDVTTQLSPDGRYIAFANPGPGGASQLWVRPFDSLSARALPGTEDASFPFWSPDSRSIGFFAQSKLKKIDVAGGPALTLGDAPVGRGATWNQDAVILFTPIRTGPILRVPAAGGTSRPVTKLAAGEYGHRWPWFLPDGRHFLYAATRDAGTDHTTIHIGDLASPEDKVVGEADSDAIYAQGFLLFLRETTLMAQPFDPKRLAATGDAVPLAERIQRRLTTAYAEFSASANGLLAYRAGGAAADARLTWFDRSGKQLATLGDPGDLGEVNFSPDRKSVAVAMTDLATNNRDIWIYDTSRGLRTRFTFDLGADESPVWSPDGRTIIFSSRRKQQADLYRKSSDGVGTEELLYGDNLAKSPTSWSRDGRFLLYNNFGSGTMRDIWVLPLTPERPGAALKPVPFVQTPFDELNGQFSPDGRWVAYQSNESQRNEIYIAPFPGPGGKRQVSVAGGATPRWRKDGKEIFYVAPDLRLMAAEVTAKGNTLEIGEVRPLFGPLSVGLGFHYDVSADGQRFLTVPPQQESAEPVTLVQNWVAGLRK
jgi:Tol biopolymer transport system component